MAAIAPNSTIILFKDIPFDPAYNDTMYYASKTAQTGWFSNLPAAKKRTYTAVSYQRRSQNVIRLEEVYANVFDVNYMAFKNTSFENKWFYAFVESVEYINNITVEITYQLDVIQSWLFDDPVTNLANSFSQCVIERCHTRTDDFGEHTLPENLPLGDYIYTDATAPALRDSEYRPTPCIVVATSLDFTATNIGDTRPGTIYAGRAANNKGDYYSGIYLNVVPLTNVAALNTWLENVNDSGYGNAILSIAMGDAHFFTSSESVAATAVPVDAVRPGSLGSYTPKNTKLLIYPFTMLAVSDFLGHENTYQWELFTYAEPTPGIVERTVHFEVWGNRATNPSLIMYAKNYKGQAENFDESMQSMQFPACGWNSDTFKAMLAQSWSTPMMSSAGQALVGNVAGGVQTAIGAGLDIAAIAMNPANHVPTLHGAQDVNLGYQTNGVLFKLREKMIRPEYAAIIDQYFDMYGYRVETVGIPDINARPNWTYVKTRGASVHGLMPADDARKIEGIFNNGIRFWTVSAAAGFGNYNTDNSPVQQNSGSGSGGSSSVPAPVTPTPTTPTENEGE